MSNSGKEMIAIKTKKSFRKKYKNELSAYALLAYPLVHWAVFFVIALGFTLYISFTSWDILTTPVFVGLQNYIEIITKDEVFKQALENTAIWTLGTATISISIALFIAFLLNGITELHTFFRTLLYWPALVSIIAVVNMQKLLFESTPYSMANKILGVFGMSPVAWFDNPNIALYSLMLWPIILGFPQPMLFFLAGLKQMPATLYEAAIVDGASKGKIFFKITLPLLKPIVFLNVILGLISGFRIIAPMQLITNGGPANATTSLVYRIYQEGFQFTKMGYASAMSVVLLIIVLIITIIQYKFQGEKITFD